MKAPKGYTGPLGPHLSNMTQTTMGGTYEEKKQLSIHPTGRHNRLHRRREGNPNANGSMLICDQKRSA